MKTLMIAVSVCLVSVWNIAGQDADNSEPVNSPVAKVTLAKTGPDGFIVEDPESFRPGDIPIHCYVDLKEEKPSLIKVVFVAVRAKGLRPNHVITSMKYQTKEGEIGAEFDAKPNGKWAVGDYRVDVFVDENKVEEREFVISP